jgi:hypothetical protein
MLRIDRFWGGEEMGVIEDTLKVIEEVTAQSRELFVGLSAETLNWKPAPGRWSAGQCLDHLITANNTYFPIFEQVRRGEHRARAWERVPLLPALFGRSLAEGLSGEAAEMMEAPAVFRPSQSSIPSDIVPRFLAHQDELAAYIRGLREDDLGRVITSPASRWVVYSLRDTCRIIAAHEALHFRQAKRTLELSQSKTV